MLSQRNIEKRVEEELARDERWKVIVRGNSWLCPYCLRIGARDLRMDEPVEEKIALHFVRDCQAYDYFQVEPQPIERLRHRARLLVFKGRVVRWILDERRFRFGDDEGRWICPYCLQVTAAELPERALDDPDAFGPAPEESPFLDDAVAHLLDCPIFAEGEDQLRSLRELEEERVRSARRGRLRRLRARFERERSFQLLDNERRWLCPFCGVAQDLALAPGEAPGDAFFGGMAAHLDLCKAHRVLGSKPLAVSELRTKVEGEARVRQLEKIRHKVSRHPIWRIRDLEGVWYCPYCAQETLVGYPERTGDAPRDAEAFERFLAAVLQHLAGCDDYRRPGAKVRGREELAAAIARVNVALDLRRRVRKQLAEDPLFGVTDEVSNWLCPYCRTVQKQIHRVAAAESAVVEKTAEQVIVHLTGDCEGFDPERPPQVERAQLEALVRDASLHTSGVRERGVASPTDSLDEASWRRIKQDIEVVRSRVARVERHASSLREARSKQLRMLPSLPALDGFEFGRVYKPCDEVGGDFYDVFQVSPTTWALAVGDVSGHGIEAALLMGLAKKLLEVHGRSGASPAQTLCLANRDIFSDLDERTFVTVFYGLLDVEARRFRFARAGHDPLVLYNPARSPALAVLDSKGMALGMDEGPVFERVIEELEVAIEPGDLLLQYTDGVTEAMNAVGEQFGRERLYEVLAAHGEHEVEYVLWKLEKAVEAFSRGVEPSDDVTMIGLKVLP